ncbi:hypothetical protein [Caloramator sp. mosi_1]
MNVYLDDTLYGKGIGKSKRKQNKMQQGKL